MNKYPVSFPADPFVVDGLPSIQRKRASLCMRAFQHAPLMRVLAAVEEDHFADYLLDLANLGAIHLYGLQPQLAQGVIVESAHAGREPELSIPGNAPAQKIEPIATTSTVQTVPPDPASTESVMERIGLSREAIMGLMNTASPRREVGT